MDDTLNNIQIIRSPLISCRHGFSTRVGGVSLGLYDSLNLGLNRGDDPAHVAENWKRFGQAVGIDTKRFVHGPQVHGSAVRVARASDAHSIFQTASWPGADGYVTNIPDLPLVIFTADCTPLLLEDPAARVVGAVHCGWRSTAADIMANAVEKMVSLGAAPENIRAAIGPGIRQCCFQTSLEVPQALDSLLKGQTDGLYAPDRSAPGKYRVDLPGAVARRLEQLGLLPEHIGQTGQCTMCDPGLFWSHRAMGTARGSQANIIAL